MAGRVRGNKKPSEDRLSVLKEAYFEYLELSKMLFASTLDPVYDMNELPADNKFLKPAQRLAKEMEIDWKTMAHEDSNRIMLALLEKYYNKMAEVANTTDITIQVNFKLNLTN